MGKAQASGMAEWVRDGNLSLEAAIRWHLRFNHFPPVNEAFVPACVEAIDLIRSDDGDEPVFLPNGRTATAWQIIDGLHLEDFCYDE